MNQFEKYCARRFKSLKKNLEKYIEKDDKEGLHQFRLELKKINAVLHFIAQANGNKSVRKPGKIITGLLKSAGELRDASNFKKLANEFKLPKDISCEAIRQRQLKKAASKLKSDYRHQHVLNKAEKQLDNEAKKLVPAQLKSYVTDLMADISNAALKKIPATQLHELRKKMKDALYLFKLSAGKKPGKKTRQLLEKLSECQDVIGQWHDIDKFKERIKKVKHPHLNSKMNAVNEEEKRLLIETYRLIQLSK